MYNMYNNNNNNLPVAYPIKEENINPYIQTEVINPEVIITREKNQRKYCGPLTTCCCCFWLVVFWPVSLFIPCCPCDEEEI